MHTSVQVFFYLCGYPRRLIERRPPKPKVTGSNPVEWRMSARRIVAFPSVVLSVSGGDCQRGFGETRLGERDGAVGQAQDSVYGNAMLTQSLVQGSRRFVSVGRV